MLVDWSDEFDQWLDRVEQQGGRFAELTTALLQALVDLEGKPDEESATFKRVRPARRHELWRVAHPFDPEHTVRIICWFPDQQTVVVAIVDAWIRLQGERS